MMTVYQRVEVTPNGRLVVLTPLYVRYFENTEVLNISTLSGAKTDSFRVSFNREDKEADLYLLEYEDCALTQSASPIVLEELTILGDI